MKLMKEFLDYHNLYHKTSIYIKLELKFNNFGPFTKFL